LSKPFQFAFSEILQAGVSILLPKPSALAARNQLIAAFTANPVFLSSQ